MNRYVIIDGYKYAIIYGTYIRRWQRQFTATLVANIVELNFVDNGPGVRVYSFTILCNTWDPSSLPYQDGITQTYAQQIANLEAAYAKTATALQFVDPFGNSPSLGGVYFTNLNEIIPTYATVQKPYVTFEVEVTEAKKAI